MNHNKYIYIYLTYDIIYIREKYYILIINIVIQSQINIYDKIANFCDNYFKNYINNNFLLNKNIKLFYIISA